MYKVQKMPQHLDGWGLDECYQLALLGFSKIKVLATTKRTNSILQITTLVIIK